MNAFDREQASPYQGGFTQQQIKACAACFEWPCYFPPTEAKQAITSENVEALKYRRRHSPSLVWDLPNVIDHFVT